MKTDTCTETRFLPVSNATIGCISNTYNENNLTFNPIPTPSPKLTAWEAALDEKARTVFEVAAKLYMALPLHGACYHYSFFLQRYLQERYGIHGRAIVGFINDGHDTIYTSHAWYSYEGTITDLAVSRPMNTAHNWRGPLRILDQTLINGWHWSYHHPNSKRGRGAVAHLTNVSGHDQYAALALSLHQLMSDVGRCEQKIARYLDRGGQDITYATMVHAVETYG